MSISIQYDEQENLKKFIFLSLMGHLIFFIGGILINELFFGFNFKVKPKPKIIGKAIRVDMVDMPHLTIKELEKINSLPKNIQTKGIKPITRLSQIQQRKGITLQSKENLKPTQNVPAKPPSPISPPNQKNPADSLATIKRQSTPVASKKLAKEQGPVDPAKDLLKINKKSKVIVPKENPAAKKVNAQNPVVPPKKGMAPSAVAKKKPQKVALSEMLKNLSQQKVSQMNAKEKAKVIGRDGAQVNGIKERKIFKGLILAGNKISKGSAMTGDSRISEAMTQEYAEYGDQIEKSVKKNWALPTYLLDKKLVCRIRIYISSQGNLLKAEVMETSGNKDFDQKAMRAVRRGSPFPVPSEKIQKELASSGFILGFPL